MAKRKATSTSKKNAKKTPAQIAAQEALQLTWLLKGKLKSAQIAYLRIGEMLAEVREKEMFKVLHHDNLEAYADERLNLGRSALYQYLDIYDWVVECHREWLQPKPKGYIPVLTVANNLRWIERKLAAKDLDAETRTKLEELRARGLVGRLRPRDMKAFREWSQPDTNVLRTLLAKLRTLRRNSARLKSIPPEVLSKLDGAVEVVEHAMAAQKAGVEVPRAA